MDLLYEKVIIVTGGAGLLGREFIEAIIKQGGIGVIADIDKKTGLKTFSDLKTKYKKGNVDFFQLDITKKESIALMIKYLNKKYRRIDAVVNNAYPRNENYGQHFFNVEYKDFCENVCLHLGGYFLIMQQFAEYFKKQGYGNIINIASIYGVIAPRFEIYNNTYMTTPVEYAAIKSAIIHLTKYVAKYYKGHNIRVNCISPGGIYNNQPESFIKSYNKYALNKGMLEPSDITGTLLFLLSDESKYINGQNIVVDDGWSL